MKTLFSSGKLLFLLLSCAVLLNVSTSSGFTVALTPDTHNGYNISCFGGHDCGITTTITGGTAPFTYLWSWQGVTADHLSSVPAGYYHVLVTDFVGATAEAEITLTQPDPLVIGAVVTVNGNGFNTSCYGCADGAITINVSGGVSAYGYAWSPSSSLSSRTNLAAGPNDLTVTDQNGCVSTQHFTISSPERDDWTLAGNNGSNPPTQFLGTIDNKDFVFKTYNTEKMRLTSTGNLGIGITSPGNALHVVRTLSGGGDYGAFFNITSSGSASYQRGVFVQLNAGYTGTQQADALVGGNLAAGSGNGNHFNGVYTGNHGVLGATAGSTSTGTNVAVMGYARYGILNIGMFGTADDVKSGGTNIGVGGTALDPTGGGKLIGGLFKLGISSTSFASAAILADNGAIAAPIFIGRDNGTEVFRIDDGGYVGIGTNSPKEKLQVGNEMVIYDGGTKIFARNFHYTGSNGVRLVSGYTSSLEYDASGDIYLHSAPTGSANSTITWNPGVVIKNNGYVGINKNGPADRLDVGGNIRLNENILYLRDNGGDVNHGLAYNALHILNSALPSIDGPVLFGFGGGALGSRNQSAPQNDKIALTWDGAGNVGIGLTPTSYRLDVCGTIRAKEIKVNLLSGCDFVFDDSYKFLSLGELKEFIDKNHHLPGIEPAKIMEADGIAVGDMQAKLLQKIEELTLYVLAQEKKIEELQTKNKN